MIKAASITSSRMPRAVFISHKSNELDSRVADLLADQLRERGISYFLDKDTLSLGDDFERRIVAAVGTATMVIVLFPQDQSSWVAFEAACAFFDRKLLPISLNGSVVPDPYNTIQTHTVRLLDGTIDLASVVAVAAEVERRLLGEPADRSAIRAFDGCNRFFYRGLQIGLAAFFIIALLLSAGTGHLSIPYIVHINHLHVILGATILGGQFFVSLAFAKAIASPIHPARDTAFKTAERLFFFWLWLTPFQPMLGVAMALLKYDAGPKPGWIWLALTLYLMGLLLTCTAYGVARAKREEDLSGENLRHVSMFNLLANILFLLGFVATVFVINLMLWKPSI